MAAQAAEQYALGMANGGTLAQPCHVCQANYDVPLSKPFCVWCPQCHVTIWLPWNVQQHVEQHGGAAAAAPLPAEGAGGVGSDEEVLVGLGATGGGGGAAATTIADGEGGADPGAVPPAVGPPPPLTAIGGDS